MKFSAAQLAYIFGGINAVATAVSATVMQTLEPGTTGATVIILVFGVVITASGTLAAYLRGSTQTTVQVTTKETDPKK